MRQLMPFLIDLVAAVLFVWGLVAGEAFYLFVAAGFFAAASWMHGATKRVEPEGVGPRC